jgi:hypothetical protein
MRLLPTNHSRSVRSLFRFQVNKDRSRLNPVRRGSEFGREPTAAVRSFHYATLGLGASLRLLLNLSTFPMENCGPESEYPKSVQQKSTLPASSLKANLSNSILCGDVFIFVLTARSIIKPPPSSAAPPEWLPRLVRPCKAWETRGYVYGIYPCHRPSSPVFPIHFSPLTLRPQRTSGWLRTNLRWTSLKRRPKTCLPCPGQRRRQSFTIPTIRTKAFLVCRQRMEEKPHGCFWPPHSWSNF